MDRHHSTHRSFRHFIDDKLTVPIVQLIASTTTDTGLTLTCQLDGST
jgi:hypothetical protein